MESPVRKRGVEEEEEKNMAKCTEINSIPGDFFVYHFTREVGCWSAR